MLIDLVLLLCLILLNGVFAMSEIAIVGSKRARLLQMADGGSAGAQQALTLAAEPTRFLSSVQVGITTIGILNGAIGEASVAAPVRAALDRIPFLAPYAETLSLVVMVVTLTYVSLILGELVPKRLALTHPERIASVIAPPMELLGRIGRPIVFLLSLSTDGVLRLLGVRQVKQPAVTQDEIKVLLEQGAEEGVFAPSEHEMMTNVLNLDERRVSSVLTPRADVVFLDIRDSLDAHRSKLGANPHAVLPVCDGGLQQVLGVVRVTRLLNQITGGTPLDLTLLIEPALFVPETMTLMKLLEQFKRTHLPIAVVVDEFGDTQGLVSLTDVTSSIVGDLPTGPGEEPPVVRREDGSFLVDGSAEPSAALRLVGIESLFDDDERRHYHTFGGLMMLVLGRVPRTGDLFERGEWRFEVVDMDGNRVDRVLVSRAPGAVPPRR